MSDAPLSMEEVRQQKTRHQLLMEIEELNQQLDSRQLENRDYEKQILVLMRKISLGEDEKSRSVLDVPVFEQRPATSVHSADPTGRIDEYVSSVHINLYFQILFAHFQRFLADDASSNDNLLWFWLDVETFKMLNSEDEMKTFAVFLYTRYIKPDADMDLQFDSKLTKEIGRMGICVDSFDAMQQAAYEQLFSAFYSRFMKHRVWGSFVKMTHICRYDLFKSGNRKTHSPYRKVAEVLLAPPYEVFVALARATPSSQLADCSKLFARLLEDNDLFFHVLRSMLLQDVGATERQGELFRVDTITTKLFGLYAKSIGGDYLKDVLRDTIKEMQAVASKKGSSFEVDPNRVKPGQDAKKNLKNLQKITDKFLDHITLSEEAFPKRLRVLISQVQHAVVSRFPESRHQCVGGFVFLRFINPAIVAPTRVGLMDKTEIITPEMMRGLVLITKVLQNLANQLVFGKKEQYMIEMNDFIEKNMKTLQDFFDRLTAVPGDVGAPPPIEGLTVDDVVMQAVHFYVEANLMDQEDVMMSTFPDSFPGLKASLEGLPEPSDAAWRELEREKGKAEYRQ